MNINEQIDKIPRNLKQMYNKGTLIDYIDKQLKNSNISIEMLCNNGGYDMCYILAQLGIKKESRYLVKVITDNLILKNEIKNYMAYIDNSETFGGVYITQDLEQVISRLENELNIPRDEWKYRVAKWKDSQKIVELPF